jgi:tetratricopeptide (TPR) repeat protein
VINYSQPLPVAAEQPNDPPVESPVPNQAQPQQQPEDPNAKAAAEIFDQARALFKKGAYQQAQATIEKAIEKLPQDPTLHEFRALCLFSQGKYMDAAGAIYAVLGAGPGWNSDTLFSLYENQQIFMLQLQQLVKFANENPKAGYAQFLLGYEYLTIGEKDKAITGFSNAAKLDPKDELSANLVKMLKEGDAQP